MAIKDNKYFLVGMPSSGKTTIGRHVATQLGLKFLDLDHLISDETGNTIAEIFEQKGEEYFRELERKHIQLMVGESGGFIMATGGGAPCHFDNMAMMNKNGITIYLEVTVEDLFNKLLRKGTQKRPLLRNLTREQLHSEIKSKYESRKVFYEQSTIRLRQKFNDLADRVNEVLDAIQSLEK